ncbi:DinB family protein [Tundrisphaera lichenicola]|uniref:DinB family protein n=1 Tax=Tundrisphaera lichenicola TaxID=2029860 RepID=UPI003EBCFE2A
MDAKNMIRQSIDMADMAIGKYLDGLDDAGFLVRPIEGMNPIAWQLGHLIVSERGMNEAIKPGSCPPLPEGFEAKHPRQPLESGDYLSKSEYLAVWKEQRDATRALLESLTDADLEAPAPESIRGFCPTVAHALNMMAGIHPMMHAGQFVAVRRQLDMPNAI